MLARPATPFVAELVDAHDVLRLLAVIPVAEAVVAPAGAERDAAQSISAGSTLRDALWQLAARGDGSLRVVRGETTAGVVTVEGILAAVRRVAAAKADR